MSALPSSGSDPILFWVWVVTIAMFAVALIVCGIITVRRVRRNRVLAEREAQRAAFQGYIGRVLREGRDANPTLENIPECRTRDVTYVLLHYFRTLKGAQFSHLHDLVAGTPMETRIADASHRGIRGCRMRAVRTLSYVQTDTAIRTVAEHLRSDDKYVRLTAAQCLVRLNALDRLDAIVAACVEAFPYDAKILSGLLSAYGRDAVPDLERLVRESGDATVMAGALGALRAIMPEHVGIDCEALMDHDSDAVRAGAVALSTVSGDTRTLATVRRGLAQDGIAVKIQSAKTACTMRRADLTPDLYALAGDPELWVRYWALRAIWMSGRAGEAFVASLSGTVPTAAHVDREMRAGYV